MPTYNYQDGWIFALRGVTTDALFTSTNAIVSANCTYLGVLKSSSGWEPQPSYSERDSTGNTLNLKFELNIDVNVLTTIDSTLRGYLDGVTLALVFVPNAYVSVNRETGVVTLGVGTATMIVPTELFVGQPTKAGQQEVVAIQITGKAERTSKASLIKSVTTANA